MKDAVEKREDVETDIQEAMHDEADAQKNYEEAMKDAVEKREEVFKLSVEKEGSKADTITKLQVACELSETKSDQLGTTQDKEQCIHVDCDHLLGHIERHVAAPAARPLQYPIISNLSSDTVLAPRNLSVLSVMRLT